MRKIAAGTALDDTFGIARAGRIAWSALFVLSACRTSSNNTIEPTPTSRSTPIASSVATSVSTAPMVADATAPAQTREPPTLSAEDLQADAMGERAFAVGLFKQVSKTETQNLFLSPASARFAMAMVMAGARGVSEAELQKVLGASAKTHDVAASLTRDWAGLATPSGAGETVTLQIANRIFPARSQAVLPAFLALTRDRYGAPAETMDYEKDAAGAREKINEWVEAHTARRIKNLIDSAPLPTTKMILVNAVYFKAPWEAPFEPSATKSESFYVPSGAHPVPMMHDTRERLYADAGDAHVVELPYGSRARHDLSMVVIVPKANDGLAALESKLTEEQLGSWLRAGTSRRQVALALPKFRIDSKMRLNEVIAAMGAPSLFDPQRADFSGIDGVRDLTISLILQKTFVEVDEKGTEAAAATVVMMTPGAALLEPQKPVVVRVDRPFLFVIRDAVRGRVLFMGRVTDPKS